jgi:hypothetical protein
VIDSGVFPVSGDGSLDRHAAYVAAAYVAGAAR